MELCTTRPLFSEATFWQPLKKWPATVWLILVPSILTIDSNPQSQVRWIPWLSGGVEVPPATPPFVIKKDIISFNGTISTCGRFGGAFFGNLATVIYAPFSLVLDLVRWNWWTEEWHRNDVDNIRLCALPGRRFKQGAYMNLQFFRPFWDLHIFGGMFHLGSFGTWAFSPLKGLGLSLCVPNSP